MLFLRSATYYPFHPLERQIINAARNILFLLILALSSQVAAKDVAVIYKKEREAFVAAEDALKRGKITEYQELRKGLENYPLYPYLEYGELRYGFSSKKLPRVKEFLKRYPDLPVSDLLRSSWLNHLAAKKEWDSYLDLYTPQSSIERQCSYIRALISTNEREKAYKLVKPIWLHGSSQPDDCNQVFKEWQNAGKLTPKLVWGRIELAMQEGETSLARYLRRYLPAKERGWFDQWIHIHNNPERMARHNKLIGPKRLQQAIQAHGLKQLAHRNIDTALKVWERLQKNEEKLPAELMQQAEHTIALRLLRSGHKRSLEFLDRIQPQETDTLLHEKRLRHVLTKQKWDLLNKWTQQLPPQLKSSDEWRYWNARALVELGKKKEAKAQLQQLTKERSFYGFLAADLLNADYNLDFNPTDVTIATIKQLEKNPGLVRSREMFLLNRFVSGRREWRAATNNMSSQQLKGAAILARDWGLHDRSIAVLAQAGLWEDLNLRFPIAHRKHVDEAARKKDLDSAWVFAVIRQESAFVQDAHSPAGALGLMQLMPRTARSTARRLKMGSPQESKILQPEINILLGTSYLKSVLDELGENMVLATAAYNAGPGRVRGWLPKKPMPADLWIATVPVDETRGYLQRVLAYTVIYKQRLGKNTGRLSDSMPLIQRNLRKTAQHRMNAALQKLMSAQ